MGGANKQDKQCAGCAFRPGGAANRELYNHLRATICMLGPLPFLCHDGRDWADPDNHKFTPGEMFRRGWSICQGWRREVARLAATGYYANNTEVTRSFAKAALQELEITLSEEVDEEDRAEAQELLAKFLANLYRKHTHFTREDLAEKISTLADAGYFTQQEKENAETQTTTT